MRDNILGCSLAARTLQETGTSCDKVNLLATELFFFNFSTPLYKM